MNTSTNGVAGNSGPARIAASIRADKAKRGIALVPYLTAGFPTKAAFASALRAIAPVAAVIEIGVPFSDPMADGVTIQRSSRVALEQGVTLGWILDELAAMSRGAGAETLPPIVLMSYLNPLLSLGVAGLASRCAAAGVAGLIIPDLPLEESGLFKRALNGAGVGLINMVTPVTAPARAKELAQGTDGFLYAVTSTGVTGTREFGAEVGDYLDSLRGLSAAPVCAGFGIRSRNQVQALSALCDGGIVGSAVVEVVERGGDAGGFLRGLVE